jgi:hypothetical protein
MNRPCSPGGRHGRRSRPRRRRGRSGCRRRRARRRGRARGPPARRCPCRRRPRTGPGGLLGLPVHTRGRSPFCGHGPARPGPVQVVRPAGEQGVDVALAGVGRQDVHGAQGVQEKERLAVARLAQRLDHGAVVGQAGAYGRRGRSSSHSPGSTSSSSSSLAPLRQVQRRAHRRVAHRLLAQLSIASASSSKVGKRAAMSSNGSVVPTIPQTSARYCEVRARSATLPLQQGHRLRCRGQRRAVLLLPLSREDTPRQFGSNLHKYLRQAHAC